MGIRRTGPIPAVPILLAAGAMAADGKVHFGFALIVGLIGSMLADAGWYEAGRLRGISLIHSLCRLSLEKGFVRQANAEALRNLWCL